MKILTRMTGALLSTAFLLAAPLTLVNLAAPASAQALSAKSIVDQAKQAGLVGEQLDGYLGFISNNVSADIRAAVNEINIKRKSLYTKIAREKGVSVSDVAGLSGEKLVAKAAPGTYVKLGDGQWHKVG